MNHTLPDAEKQQSPNTFEDSWKDASDASTWLRLRKPQAQKAAGTCKDAWGSGYSHLRK